MNNTTFQPKAAFAMPAAVLTHAVRTDIVRDASAYLGWSKPASATWISTPRGMTT